MTILEQILAGLQTKFTGVDAAILTRIATKKAEGVTDETMVNSIVEGISFSDVLNSYGDFRAGDASKTAVTNYEKRHNLKDGKPIETTTTTKTEHVASRFWQRQRSMVFPKNTPRGVPLRTMRTWMHTSRT